MLEPKACYKALLARDARWDGRFFTAVSTTRIYCRPVCPAPPPKFTNVRFYAVAAAAAAAGYRPCRRCRPETAPGSPAWNGTSATVARALRLIASGAGDESGVEGLAAQLGLGARQVRRLFDRHVGATPVAVAQTRRVHFAKRLLDETTLPVTEVAWAAGFRSLRRFNSVFKETFDMAPSAMRRGRVGAGTGDTSNISLKLAFRPPFDWQGLVAFLAARAIPGVERVTAETYARTVRLGDVTGVVSVRRVLGGSHVVLAAPAEFAPVLLDVVGRVRRVFDLDADPAAIADALGEDELLSPVFAKRPGLRVPGAWDVWELAVRAILGQQVSVAGACTMLGRLVAAHGETLAGPAALLTHVFPGPERLAAARLEEIGLTGRRAETVRELARRVARGERLLSPSPTLEEAIARLVAVPGIGPWTAQYIAMRALAEPDAFPAGDLWLRRAVAQGGEDWPERRLRERAEAWRPWRAYAALALWSTLT